jgi:CRP-like cAMP-binding protein
MTPAFAGRVNRDFFSFCTSLRLVELKAIGTHSRVQHFRKGDRIYSAGDEGQELFVITRGAVELLAEKMRPGAHGIVLSRGDIFGVMGAILTVPRDYSIRACSALSAQCFHRSDFDDLLAEVPSFFLFLCEKLAARLFQVTELARSRDSALELSGTLANFDIVTVYQTIQQSQQTGVLTIAKDEGEPMAEFYFEKGAPRSGRFEHLVGEEAFWQLFLEHEAAETFSFSHSSGEENRVCAETALARRGDDLLLHAIHMRDQFHDARQRLREGGARLHCQQEELKWNDVEFAELRPLAENIWRLAATREIALRDLYRECEVCELKIYQVINELIRSGQLKLDARAPKSMLISHQAGAKI